MQTWKCPPFLRILTSRVALYQKVRWNKKFLGFDFRLSISPWWPQGPGDPAVIKSKNCIKSYRNPLLAGVLLRKMLKFQNFDRSQHFLPRPPSSKKTERQADLVLKYLVLEQLEVAPYPHNHAWEQRWIKEDSERKQLIVFRLASSHRINAVLESIRQAWYG